MDFCMLQFPREETADLQLDPTEHGFALNGLPDVSSSRSLVANQSTTNFASTCKANVRKDACNVPVIS